MADRNEIRIVGVPQKLLDELKNVAKNTGVTVSALLKPKVREFVDSFPERMRQQPPDQG